MIEKFRSLFGDENAERDPLLHACKVSHSRIGASKPILTGRWGTGKTAILLLQNHGLSVALKAVNRDLERLWYLDESTLDLQSLLGLQAQIAPMAADPNQHQLFIRALESVWKAEIIRVFRQILAALHEAYGSPRGPHWEWVLKSQPRRRSTSLWRQLPQVFVKLVGRGEAASAVASLEDSVSELFTDRAQEHLRACLEDIAQHDLYPLVAIEPIETPASAIEVGNQSLAQALVTALLNVFQKHFAPDETNPFFLRVSIPWHRFDLNTVDFPQKLPQYRGNVQWGKADLRKLIDKRIEWEFNRVGRQVAEELSWSTLFPKTLKNSLCEPPIHEDSFDYFARHTHHRARDLIRIVRHCVEAEAENRGIEVDEVLRDRQQRVSVHVIKDTLRRIGLQATRELLNEGARRHPEVAIIGPFLTGLAQPFSLDAIEKRLVGNHSDISVLKAAHILWECGIIGVTAVPANAEASRRLTSALTDDARVVYQGRKGVRLSRWSWFEYNWDGDVTDILARIATFELSSSGIVFHPKTFEYFSPAHHDRTSPIGI